MVEFGTKGLLEIELSQRSLRSAEKEIEERITGSPITVDVEGSGGGGSDRIPTLLDEGLTLDRERNELLEQLIEEVEETGQGRDGGLPRGGGGMGGIIGLILAGAVGGLLGGLSNFSWPELPDWTWPDLPDWSWPDPPEIPVPSIPELEVPEIDPLEVPEIPPLGVPEIPPLKLPNIPSIPIAPPPFPIPIPVSLPGGGPTGGPTGAPTGDALPEKLRRVVGNDQGLAAVAGAGLGIGGGLAAWKASQKGIGSGAGAGGGSLGSGLLPPFGISPLAGASDEGPIKEWIQDQVGTGNSTTTAQQARSPTGSVTGSQSANTASQKRGGSNVEVNNNVKVEATDQRQIEKKVDDELTRFERRLERKIKGDRGGLR